MSDVASRSGVSPIRGRLESSPMTFWHASPFIVCASTLLCDSADQFLIISIAPLLIREWGITSVDIGLTDDRMGTHRERQSSSRQAPHRCGGGATRLTFTVTRR